MKTVTIEAPEGYKIDAFDQQTGKVTFIPIPKEAAERIKTFDDVLAELGIKKDDFMASCHDMTADEVAYRQLVLVAQALNEGWAPDWGNSNQYKYYPWFNMGGSSGSGFSFHGCDFGVRSFSAVGSRLCYKTRALAEYAGKQFTEIYKQFYLINN